jgi:hypothetical protein
MSFYYDDYQHTNKKASRHENDPFDLRNRFVVKQKEVYARALSEIKAGRKSRCSAFSDACILHPTLHQELVYATMQFCLKERCIF